MDISPFVVIFGAALVVAAVLLLTFQLKRKT